MVGCESQIHSDKNTINIYRKALAFLADIYDEEWENLEGIANKRILEVWHGL